jgi:uncharacterized phage protein gp47/JayE
MPTTGITDAGYTAPRAADYLADIRAAINNRLVALGLTPLATADWDRDVVYGLLSAVLATELGSLAQATQGLVDARSITAATGSALDTIGVIRGIARNGATASTATVTITGTVGRVFPAGGLFQGGGTDDLAQWITSADATVGAGGTVDVAVVCTVEGATAAAIGEIDTVVTAVDGITAATNAAAATVGRDVETDADYRVRLQTTQSASGAASAGSLRSALLALDYVTGAVVVENASGASVTDRGITTPAHAITVVIAPSTVTTAQQTAIAEVIYGKTAAGIQASGADVSATVTGGDGLSKTIAYDLADALAVTVACTVTLDAGYVLGDVSDPINTAVTALFATLNVGDKLALLDVYAAIATVAGVEDVTALTLNGGVVTIVPDLDEVATLSGTVSVST